MSAVPIPGERLRTDVSLVLTFDDPDAGRDPTAVGAGVAATDSREDDTDTADAHTQADDRAVSAGAGSDTTADNQPVTVWARRSRSFTAAVGRRGRLPVSP